MKNFFNGNTNLWLIQKNNYTKYSLSFAISSLFSIFFCLCPRRLNLADCIIWTFLLAGFYLVTTNERQWKGNLKSLFLCFDSGSVLLCSSTTTALASQPHFMALIVTRLPQHHFFPLFFWSFG